MHHPVLIPGRTGRIAHHLIARQGSAINVGDPRGPSPRHRRQHKLGIAINSAPRLAVHESRITGHNHGLVLIEHIAMGVDRIGLKVTGNIIRPKMLVRTNHLRGAFEVGDFITQKFKEIRMDIDRRLVTRQPLLRRQNKFHQWRRRLSTHFRGTASDPRIDRQLAHQALKALLIFPGHIRGFRPMLRLLTRLTHHMSKAARVPTVQRTRPTAIRPRIH